MKEQPWSTSLLTVTERLEEEVEGDGRKEKRTRRDSRDLIEVYD